MDLLLLGTAFIAGGLTILAPCMLPLLPVIIGGSAGSEDKWRPVVITTSLAISIVVFTLILRATTALIDIPQSVWTSVSGGILIFIGILMLFPGIWAKIAHKTGFESGSGKLLSKAGTHQSRAGGILIGAAMGPVFSSCSPTYFVILATILPASFFVGLIYLMVYALGVAVVMGLIAFFGQRIVIRLRWAANPTGWFKRGMGILLIIVGLAIATGLEKKAEIAILDAGYGISDIEMNLLEKVTKERTDEMKKDAMESAKTRKPVLPKEFRKDKSENLETENQGTESRDINPDKKTDQPDSELTTPNPQLNNLGQSDFKLPVRNLKTDTSKASINLSEILGGGPPKDGIPAINKPKFIPIKEADIDDDVLGVFVDLNNAQRFYPYTILVWHEIVNDTLGNKPIAISFCPLCGSAIVYNRVVNNETLEFGVSGLLFESNLLMYDDKTESLWSQARGEAVVGDYTGTELEVLPMQLISFKEVKNKYPNSEVLSADTGFNRNYGVYPYGDYEESEKMYFSVSVNDKRYFSKEIMYVVDIDDKSVSFPYKNIPEGQTEISDLSTVLIRDGGEVHVEYNNQELPGYFEMWFSWSTHHQNDGVVWDNFQ